MHRVQGQAIAFAVKQLRFPEPVGNLDRQLTVSFHLVPVNWQWSVQQFIQSDTNCRCVQPVTFRVDPERSSCKIVNVKPGRNLMLFVQPVGTVGKSGLWDGIVRNMGSIGGRGKIQQHTAT